MKMVDMEIRKYIELLASNAPAPGGGSAAALAGAQGMALTSMVLSLTVGREKYAAEETMCREALAVCSRLREELLAEIDRDTEAYSAYSAALKLPKETTEEKETRKTALAQAAVVATDVPLHTMELCLAGLQATEPLIGRTNRNAVSDLGVAALNLMGGIKGAWLNVKINLPGIKDAEKRQAYVSRGQYIFREGERIAKQIYGSVEAGL